MFTACRRGAVSIYCLSNTASPFFAPIVRSSVLSLTARKFIGPAIVSRNLNSSSALGYNAQSFASKQQNDGQRDLESGTVTENDALYTKFQELADSGLVHASIIREITHGMGYQTMTPVQKLAISHALKGIDTSV